jgi:hypothetical protein
MRYLLAQLTSSCNWDKVEIRNRFTPPCWLTIWRLIDIDESVSNSVYDYVHDSNQYIYIEE